MDDKWVVIKADEHDTERRGLPEIYFARVVGEGIHGIYVALPAFFHSKQGSDARLLVFTHQIVL